jgi:hypothetical protein
MRIKLNSVGTYVDRYGHSPSYQTISFDPRIKLGAKVLFGIIEEMGLLKNLLRSCRYLFHLEEILLAIHPIANAFYRPD